MKKYTIALIFLLILSISALVTMAQNTDALLKVTGEVATPLELKLTDFQLYNKTDVKLTDKDGNYHNYSGVVLADILQKAGVPLGKELHGKNLVKFVVAEGSDGYQAVFALAELDRAFTDRQVILAIAIDGKPLSSIEGPFRIVVQDEKKQARCVRMVTVIKVGSAK
jgi:DMSO/TMAO reductase YedYZ molybdopterin-dependent catalytic subunit